MPLVVGELTCCVDFNVAVHILRFDCGEQRHEPFKGVNVTTNPEEIDFPEEGLLIGVVHSVPDALED